MTTRLLSSMLRTTMGYRLKMAGMLLLGVIAAACSKSGDSTAPNAPPRISGQWIFTDSASNTQLGASCNSKNVALTVNQNGTSFSGVAAAGTSVCLIGGQTATWLVSGTFSSGQISGVSLTFVDSRACSYSGAMSGNPPNRISGTENCLIGRNGSAYSITGTWTASR